MSEFDLSEQLKVELLRRNLLEQEEDKTEDKEEDSKEEEEDMVALREMAQEIIDRTQRIKLDYIGEDYIINHFAKTLIRVIRDQQKDCNALIRALP
jgi:hypothetical protein